MKKVISIVVALALVLSMSVCAFATAEKPTGTPADGAALGAYYAEILNAGEVDAATIANQIVIDYRDGTIDDTTAQAFIDALIANADSTDTALALVEQIVIGFNNAGIPVPPITLPDGDDDSGNGGTGSDDNGTLLPEDDEDTADEGGFLDSILGILGGLVGGLLGGGDEGEGEGEGSGSGDGADDELGFQDDEDAAGNSDSQVTDTGDTSVIAVATVALVAGAALVLTRKKSEDAE